MRPANVQTRLAEPSSSTSQKNKCECTAVNVLLPAQLQHIHQAARVAVTAS